MRLAEIKAVRGAVKVLLALSLLLLSAVTLQAEPRVMSVHFLPPEYFVGDTVEMRVVLDPDGESILSPAALPRADWMVFRDAAVAQVGDSLELRLFFSSFAPGTRTLPDVNFRGYTLKGMKIHTSSILDENDSGEIAELQGQLYLPGTLFLIFITAFFVFAGPVIVISSAGFVRRRTHSLFLTLSRRRPYWRLRRDLKELSSQTLIMPDRDFYYALSDAVRSYISRRTGIDCITTTIHEIRMVMLDIFPQQDSAMRLIHFLEYADTIKFAGREAGAAQKGDDLLRLRELSADMEVQFRAGEGREKEEASDVDI